MTERSAAAEPRTVAGRAWLSGMRPHHRRAATPLVLSIEAEAARAALAALLEVDRVLADLATADADHLRPEALRALIDRARAAHDHASTVLEPTS
jgi:anti-sigma-K factor RskA